MNKLENLSLSLAPKYVAPYSLESLLSNLVKNQELSRLTVQNVNLAPRQCDDKRRVAVKNSKIVNIAK